MCFIMFYSQTGYFSRLRTTKIAYQEKLRSSVYFLVEIPPMLCHFHLHYSQLSNTQKQVFSPKSLQSPSESFSHISLFHSDSSEKTHSAISARGSLTQKSVAMQPIPANLRGLFLQECQRLKNCTILIKKCSTASPPTLRCC